LSKIDTEEDLERTWNCTMLELCNALSSPTSLMKSSCTVGSVLLPLNFLTATGIAPFNVAKNTCMQRTPTHVARTQVGERESVP
jgi:hypothetical protein